MLQLYIGNKNYSSWSMRAWVLMRQAGLDFEEVRVRFDGFGPESAFKRRMTALHPAGQVPLLVHDGLVVADTLAIAEYLAEHVAAQGGAPLWPRDRAARARARSACAEMHSGFAALRGACPMNIEARLPEAGALALRDRPGVRADLQRLVGLWTQLLHEYGGPLLFGGFCIADAYYAPVVMRLLTYELPVPPQVAAYMDRVVALPAVQAWMEQARAEQDFLDFEEPYRLAR